jgi:hypothetical protein
MLTLTPANSYEAVGEFTVCVVNGIPGETTSRPALLGSNKIPGDDIGLAMGCVIRNSRDAPTLFARFKVEFETSPLTIRSSQMLK